MSDVFEHARRIEQFLEDEVVQAAFAAMKQANYQLFLGAKDEPGRVVAQAQAKVLEGFEAALRGVVDAGILAKHDQEQRVRALDPRVS